MVPAHVDFFVGGVFDVGTVDWIVIQLYHHAGTWKVGRVQAGFIRLDPG